MVLRTYSNPHTLTVILMGATYLPTSRQFLGHASSPLQQRWPCARYPTTPHGPRTHPIPVLTMWIPRFPFVSPPPRAISTARCVHVAPQNFDRIKGVSEVTVAKTHVKRPQLATKFDFQAVTADICLEVGTIVIEVKMASNTEYGLLPTRYAGVLLRPLPRLARAHQAQRVSIMLRRRRWQ